MTAGWLTGWLAGWRAVDESTVCGQPNGQTRTKYNMVVTTTRLHIYILVHTAKLYEFNCFPESRNGKDIEQVKDQFLKISS
jgi:hypothetical protein